MKTYRATAVRQGRWWAVQIHDLPANVVAYTQGRDLANAEFMARDAIATALDVPLTDIAVTLTVEDATVAQALDAVAKREEAARAADAAMRAAVLTLADRGISHRDAGRILGVSHQRISQLLHAA